MKLTFPYAGIARLIEETKSAPKHIKYHDRETGPGLWLVGDSGVYLMSNRAREDGEKPQVVYGVECNPKELTFDTWWSIKRATFGADDGVEFLDLADIERLMGSKPAALTIYFNPDSFELATEPAPKPKRGPSP